MRLILAIAAAALAACSSPGAPAPGPGALSRLGGGPEADLYARYQQYRSGPGPHLDFETWKRTFGNPTDYSGSGP